MKYYITQKNLPYINNIASLYKTEISEKIPGFNINKETIKISIKDLLIDHIKTLNKIFFKINVSFEIHFKLLESIQIFHDNKDIMDPLELLRLLGILCNYAFIGPQTIHLDLTNSCNTNCLYCWWHSPLSKNRISSNYNDWKKKQLNYETIKQILNDAKDLSVNEILLTGQGEPLAHPNITEIIPLIKSKGFHTTIFTNGRLLNTNNIKSIVDNKVDILYLSFSAIDYDSYTITHPSTSKDEYEKVMENMKKLLSYSKEKGEFTYILLCFVITNKIFQLCSKFVDLSNELGIKNIRFQMMDPIPETKHLILNKEDLSKLKLELEISRKKAKEYNIIIADNITYQEETINSSGSWNTNTKNEKTCLTGWYFSRIWSDYNVSFCCSEKYIGSLKEKSFKEIWKSQSYNVARIMAKKYSSCFNCTNNRKLIDSSCNNCGNYEYIEKALQSLENTQMINFFKK